MEDKIKVMLATEGTYPFHQGGVSTWCDMLLNNITDVDYLLYSIIMNPYVTQKFPLPENVSLIKVPLWGTEEPSEHLKTPFAQAYLSKQITDEDTIKEKFVPLFTSMITEILNIEKNPARFGATLLELYHYFTKYEYKQSFKSKLVWDYYVNIVTSYAADPDNRIEMPNVYSTIQSLNWVYRFMTILNTPVPKVDVCHSAAAAFCGIPCVLAKLEYHSAFLLTEHGVYLREQYLSLASRKYSAFLNTFLIRMIHTVAELNYHFADQVSPVCNYNTRWEKEFRVEPQKIKVIYNGVDSNLFAPKPAAKRSKEPTVVTVARIDPLKDIETLIKTAAIVRNKKPGVKFIVYGSVDVPDYYEVCLKLRKQLDLENTLIFAGFSSDIPSAYGSGDIALLSSVSEAFPYSVVEAMLCGKPVVASDVGGIREALGETGFAVPPRKPDEFAEAIIKLIDAPELCAQMGRDARERALDLFTKERVLSLHLKSYINLSLGSMKIVNIDLVKTKRQALLMDKGEALCAISSFKEAIVQFKEAVGAAPDSLAAPVIMTRIADIYCQIGEYEKAYYALEKADLLYQMKKNETTA